MLDYKMNRIMSTLRNLINLIKTVEGKLAKKKAKEIASKETYFYCSQVLEDELQGLLGIQEGCHVMFHLL